MVEILITQNIRNGKEEIILTKDKNFIHLQKEEVEKLAKFFFARLHSHENTGEKPVTGQAGLRQTLSKDSHDTFSTKRVKCKMCKEERTLFMDGMCDLCWKYLNDRIFRISKESLDNAMKDDKQENKSSKSYAQVKCPHCDNMMTKGSMACKDCWKKAGYPNQRDWKDTSQDLSAPKEKHGN